MLFVDEARIFVQGGKGGQGCESFYMDKRMRNPRPDGGDGGRGGNVIFVADRALRTLLDFKYKQHYKAKSGGHASSKGKKGRTGEDCVVHVPQGTIIKDYETGLQIKDLVDDGESIVIAKGGRGGIGNGATRRGVILHEEGEQRTLLLELKMIADVGLVGFPNAGKSTIITNISKVRSPIANYPFTTKHPILGIVFIEENAHEDFSFVVADLPGIIEGAHLGKGLGHQFLRHAERTKILVHVLDMAGTEGRDPLDDYEKLNIELEKYSDKFLFKHKIVVANKMDLPEAEENLKRFKKKFGGKVIPVSAAEKQGLDKLVKTIQKVLKKIHKEENNAQEISKAG
ncbi:MAG: GTPase ObgE [Candidatus Omnitrophica bacterium]|nr:GTPase ObgE [Candidatus Omnitrophota bacterium]